MTKTLLEMSNLRQVARNERIQLAPMIEEIFTDLTPLSDKLGVTLTAEGDGIMTGSDALIYRLIFNLTENAVKYNRPAARYGFLSLRSWKSSCSASPTPAAASRRSISAVSSSPSSGWTSLAAGNTAAQDWGSHWYGRSPTSTAAPFGWRKVRRRALPLRWSCKRNNQRSPKTFLFWSA